MTFSTKTKMWWGTVKGDTENFFGKELKRIVTHEYYDNPNKPSQRPKSMHTIASQSQRKLGSGSNAGSRSGRGPSNKDGAMGSRKGSMRAVGDEYQEEADVQAFGGGQQMGMNAQAVNQNGQYYPQGDAMQMQQAGMGFQDQQQQQWAGGYGGSGQPNMMMYPQDPNTVGYPQDPAMYAQNQGMYPQQPYGQVPNMYPQGGGYPQNQQYA